MLFLINPILVVQKDDFWGSGIPYMPHILAYTAGLLRQDGFKVRVIDSFGENPFKITLKENFYWQGITIGEILEKIDEKPRSFFIYASSVTNYDFNLELIKNLKEKYPKIPVVVLANTQAVTSYDIRPVSKEILQSGADVIIYNNIEETALELIKNKFSPRGMDNVIYFNKENKFVVSERSSKIGIIDGVNLPAWELFPVENYWKLGYAHGPMEGEYLAILTSYGCPFRCKFCVNPSINQSRWQAKKPEDVVMEIEYLINKFGVREFHWEDLNPTVDKERIKEICRLIINKRLNITWKLVSGTKVETLGVETVGLMAKAGCSYISISPESGSPGVLKLMGKPYDYKLGEKIITACRKEEISTQACFVLGFPGENEGDRNKTWDYVKRITKLGVSEIALFIATPLPGSDIFNTVRGYKKISELTFSPKWRRGYKKIESFRFKLYKQFIIWKVVYHPKGIFEQGVNFLKRRFKTKMEMIPFRIIRFKQLLLLNKLRLVK